MSEPSWVERRTGLRPSVPPSHRRTREWVLDEAARPALPEPGPEVSFSRRGLQAGAHLLEVHNHYREELAQLRDLLDRVTAGLVDVGPGRGELQQMAVRLNAWGFGQLCQARCLDLTQHHALETESIFPHLEAAGAGLRSVVDTLNREHRIIHRLLERIDADLVALVQRPTDYGPIQTSVDLLSDTLESHFAYEEREILAPLSLFGFYPGQL